MDHDVIIMDQNIKKKSHSRGLKCQPKANNNCEAVVVCARHVVKRLSKLMRASSVNFSDLGVFPGKSHTNFIGYGNIIIGYSDNLCTDYTRIFDF